jgi:CBS domain-containing protein
MKVADVITQPVISVTPETAIVDAARHHVLFNGAPLVAPLRAGAGGTEGDGSRPREIG